MPTLAPMDAHWMLSKERSPLIGIPIDQRGRYRQDTYLSLVLMARNTKTEGLYLPTLLILPSNLLAQVYVGVYQMLLPCSHFRIFYSDQKFGQ